MICEEKYKNVYAFIIYETNSFFSFQPDEFKKSKNNVGLLILPNPIMDGSYFEIGLLHNL